MRDNAAPAKARRYTPFAHIAFLRMRSDYDNGDGADSPTTLEDNNEGGDAATSDWNWHKAKSAGRARRGSATSSSLLLVVCLRCWGGSWWWPRLIVVHDDDAVPVVNIVVLILLRC